MFSFIQLLSAVVIGVTFAQAQGNCARMYTVKDGDTCDTIAAANMAPSAQIIAANAGTINAQCNNLKVGSSICLGMTGQDCQTTYTVMAGDTCFEIAQAQGIEQDVFTANNTPCPNIYPGLVLCAATTSFSRTV